jgi:ribosomal protein S18 acetylase RimI-like enzyme
MAAIICLPDHFHAVSGHCIFVLEPSHVRACAALDTTIHEAMPSDKKGDFIPHDEGYYQKKIADGHKVVGAFDRGELIAKANLTLSLRDADHAPMLDKHLTPAQFEQYVMISGAAVHPDYRGRNLQFDLAKARAWLAQQAGKEHLMAVFAEGSDRSRDNCERLGMRALTPFEPSIFGGTLIQFYGGTIKDALNYDPNLDPLS